VLQSTKKGTKGVRQKHVCRSGSVRGSGFVSDGVASLNHRLMAAIPIGIKFTQTGDSSNPNFLTRIIHETGSWRLGQRRMVRVERRGVGVRTAPPSPRRSFLRVLKKTEEERTDRREINLAEPTRGARDAVAEPNLDDC